MFEQLLKKLFGWYGKRSVLAVSALVLILIVVVFTKGDSTDTVETATERLAEVKVATPASLAGSFDLSLIGSVDAKTQANLLAESTGRVVSVSVSLGQVIQPGTIIAQLENASQRAAVLQAQGAYEAAVAAGAQGSLSLTGAENARSATKNDIVSTHASAYNTISGLVLTTIDDFFADPQGPVPGLRIDGGGNATTINAARVALQTSLPIWQTTATTLSPTDDLSAALASAAVTTDSVLSLVDTLLQTLNTTGRNDSYSDEEFTQYINDLTAARAQILATKGSLLDAATDLVDADKAVAVAKLAASSPKSSNSLADAQIKQALGVLRAAEANLAKTIIRSPIGGTVNSLNVRAGDFVSMNSTIAVVANNAGLEVTTYLAEAETSNLAIGDEVVLGETSTGTITNISPAVDNTTGKVEVRIGTSATDLKTGSTVLVRMSRLAVASSRVMVPLSAVKLTTDAAAVFIVTTDGLLSALPVTLGAVSGDMVEVLSGLDNTTEIVVDARGRKAGETVTIAL